MSARILMKRVFTLVLLCSAVTAAWGQTTSTPAYLTPMTTPGVFGYRPIFYAPMWWNSDLSATKSIPVHERWKITLQGAAANVFNHPTIGIGNLAINSTSFGRVTPAGTRQIELRANMEF